MSRPTGARPPGLCPMRNRIQAYAWGSRTAIAGLQGRPVPSPGPEAELWMGAHPQAPSEVWVDGAWLPLPELIRRDPQGILGRETARHFSGDLPFLFKVLAAAEPLSVQAHPDERRARKGFARENKRGLPPDDPGRNYRDPRPKPEIFCALEPFQALVGLRPVEQVRDLAGRLPPPGLGPAGAALLRNPEPAGLGALLEALLGLEEAERVQVIEAAKAWASAVLKIRPEREHRAAYWVLRLSERYPGDVGLLAPLLLNPVQLEPGQAVFLGAGVMHAYLEGTGVELMGNSDNVLRGGLTSKRIDPPELLRILRLEGGPPAVIAPRRDPDGTRVYPTPAREFLLSELSVTPARPFSAGPGHGVEILLAVAGQARVQEDEGEGALPLVSGSSLFVPASAGPYRIDGAARLYRASVPAH